MTALRPLTCVLAVLLVACGGSPAAAPPSAPGASSSSASAAPAAPSPASAQPAPSPASAQPAPSTAPSSPSPSAASVPLASGFRDFDVVAYQGEDVFGGREVKFSSLFRSGQPVVLNYWAGLCPPCQAEMPAFQRVADAQQGKVIFFGLDVGPFMQLGSHADALILFNRLDIRYPLGYAVSVQPLRLYSVQGMPTTIFFSIKGEVVKQVTGMLTEKQLQTEIQKLT